MGAFKATGIKKPLVLIYYDVELVEEDGKWVNVRYPLAIKGSESFLFHMYLVETPQPEIGIKVFVSKIVQRL